MLISSLVTIKIAYALAKDMVNFEAAKRLAPNLFDSSRRWLLDSVQRQQRSIRGEVNTNEEEEGKNDQDSMSTEYLVHNWLEALFAWFQVIALWHEPSVSLCAISGLLSSFLLLTYFAPRFYATILIALFVFNLYKFWFRHVWPEIRVPLARDREDELRLDVDRWTYLHPQLMTLAELNQHVGNLMKLGEKYLYDMLELRQRKPVAFCSILCSIFLFTAIIGNALSGMCLIFLALTILMTAPGIYVHLLPDNQKDWLRQNIGQKLLGSIQSSHIDDETNDLAQEATEQRKGVSLESISGVTSKIPKEFIASSLSSTTKSIEHLFETLKQRSFPLIQTDQHATKSSSSSSKATSIEEEDEEDGDRDCTERTKLIDIPLDRVRDRPTITGGVDEIRTSRRSSDSSDEESTALLKSDEDDQDGFVML